MLIQDEACSIVDRSLAGWQAVGKLEFAEWAECGCALM